MIKVGIIGVTGYAGQQLLYLLRKHKKVEITFLSSNSYQGRDISEIFGNYKKYFEKKLVSQKEAEELLDKIDLLFLALPHGISENITKLALEKNIKVIDLSADFRLDSSNEYEKWYSVKHKYPNINNEAIYGLPELNREKIKNSRLIASPGCYPTSVILGLAPLLAKKLIKGDNIIIDSKSGVSGAGRGLKIESLFSEVNENFKAYNLFKHRHTPEIEQELKKLFKDELSIIFTPHIIPINRGILSTMYLDLKEELTEKEIYDLYKDFYKEEYFIRVSTELPEIKNIKNTNICEIGLRVDISKKKIIVISVIDNLIKGAGGQAIQSMNIMFGLDEKEGLDYLSMYL